MHKIGVERVGALFQSFRRPVAGLDPGLTAAEMKRCVWVKPIVICEVKFTEWTRDDRLRHPVFIGLREDKNPTNVVREKASFSGQKTGGGSVQLDFPRGKGGCTGVINGKGEAIHPMPPSSPAHSYRQCQWCGRSFKAYRSWGQTRGFFCTWICRGKAMKAFNQAASRDGNLKVMFSGFDRSL